MHLIINKKGGLPGFTFRLGNVSDNNPHVVRQMCGVLRAGKPDGDAGYVSKKLFDILFEQGLVLLTKIGRRMNNKLMNMKDKVLLEKRSLAETIIGLLKSLFDLWHTWHRSVENGINNAGNSSIYPNLRD